MSDFLRSLKKIFLKINSRKEDSKSVLESARIVINNISHEIRTPLNAIMGFADALYENETDENKKNSLLAIKDNGDRLFAIAKKLIDFSAIETGQFEIDKEYFSCDSLLMVLENKYRNQMDKKILEFKIINSVPEDYRLCSDYGVVFEILDLLLENAFKFTETGSIIIKTTYDQGVFLYRICDTGCGIPDDKKEMIFHLYKQVNSDLNREYEGLGLGLTIAQKLSQILDGSIKLSDNGKKGSCFTVSIKMPFHVIEQYRGKGAADLIPDNLTDEKKRAFEKAVHSLSGCIKIFNPDKIKITCLELIKISEHFTDLSNRLKKTAETYNELEFSQIVEEMLKGIDNEE